MGALAARSGGDVWPARIVRITLTIRIQTIRARKAKKPFGVMASTPITIASQPTHFGRAPWRTIEMPIRCDPISSESGPSTGAGRAALAGTLGP